MTGLCKTFKLTAEDITAQWMTFALKATECTVITEETLDDFEKKVSFLLSHYLHYRGHQMKMEPEGI